MVDQEELRDDEAASRKQGRLRRTAGLLLVLVAFGVVILALLVALDVIDITPFRISTLGGLVLLATVFFHRAGRSGPHPNRLSPPPA